MNRRHQHLQAAAGMAWMAPPAGTWCRRFTVRAMFARVGPPAAAGRARAGQGRAR